MLTKRRLRISWSRNSRYLLTSSKDWNAIIWDLSSLCEPPLRHSSLRFDASVVSASFHPKNRCVSCGPSNSLKVYCHDSQIILALLATGEAYVCDLRKQNRSRIELLETITDEGLEEEENNGQGILRYISSVFHHLGLLLMLASCRSPMTAARFDPTGKNIFVGTASGSILVFNTRTKTVKGPCFTHRLHFKHLLR